MVNRRHKEPDPLAETADFKRLYDLNWKDEGVQVQCGIAMVGNQYYFFSKDGGHCGWSKSAGKAAAVCSLLRKVRHTISTRPRLGVTLPDFPRPLRFMTWMRSLYTQGYVQPKFSAVDALRALAHITREAPGARPQAAVVVPAIPFHEGAPPGTIASAPAALQHAHILPGTAVAPVAVPGASWSCQYAPAAHNAHGHAAPHAGFSLAPRTLEAETGDSAAVAAKAQCVAAAEPVAAAECVATAEPVAAAECVAAAKPVAAAEPQVASLRDALAKSTATAASWRDAFELADTERKKAVQRCTELSLKAASAEKALEEAREECEKLLAEAKSQLDEAQARAREAESRAAAADSRASAAEKTACSVAGASTQTIDVVPRAPADSELPQAAVEAAGDTPQVAAAAPAATGLANKKKKTPRDQSAAPAATVTSAGKRKAGDQSAAPAATGTSSGQQQQKEAGSQKEAASKPTKKPKKSALSVPFEKSMERISVAGDGSCGFWCWLALFGRCKHAVVRTLQEDKIIKQKLDKAQGRLSTTVGDGASTRRMPQIPGIHAPEESDYALLQQVVTQMNQDDDTWDRLRDKSCGAIGLIDAARQVQVVNSSSKSVDSKDHMDAQVHLPYLAVKLGMPVYCVAQFPGLEKCEHRRIDASGEQTDLESEAAMLAEMNGFEPTPLFQCPPLFKLVDEHWSLHLPQGTFEKTYSDKRLKASKASWFNELFALR